MVQRFAPTEMYCRAAAFLRIPGDGNAVAMQDFVPTEKELQGCSISMPRYKKTLQLCSTFSIGTKRCTAAAMRHGHQAGLGGISAREHEHVEAALFFCDHHFYASSYTHVEAARSEYPSRVLSQELLGLFE